MRRVLLLTILFFGCHKANDARPSSPSGGAASTDAAPAGLPTRCGDGPCCGAKPCREALDACTQRFDGWCGGPNGDPCAAHDGVASCKADDRCEAIGYTGESMVACHGDARCFTDNCPTKGCISRCETLGEDACTHSDGRCTWDGACKRTHACATDPSGRPL